MKERVSVPGTVCCWCPYYQ